MISLRSLSEMDTPRKTHRAGRHARWAAGAAVSAAAFAVSVAAAPAAHAAAGTLVQRTGNGDTYFVIAADGRANNITISRGGANLDLLVVDDTGDVITTAPGCTIVNSHRAQCPFGSISSLTVLGGDLDDKITKTVAGPAFIDGGSGNDTISGGDGVGSDGTTLNGGAGHDTLTGGGFVDNLFGGAGTDTLVGNAGNDLLDGGAGNDRISGGPDTDTAMSSDTAADGADVFDGGPGFDTTSYAVRTAPVNVSLDGVANDGAAAEGDNDIAVEGVIGGQGSDTLTGGPDINSLAGGAGNDTIDGLAGTDNILGDAGNDSLSGGPGPVGTVLDGDIIDGGLGNDTVHYDTRTVPLTITLDAGANDGAANERDTVRTSVENVNLGSASDTVTGSTEPNIISGGNGNDTITGAGGPDVLVGGGGNDTINGVDGVLANDELDGGVGDADTCTSDGGDSEVNCEI